MAKVSDRIIFRTTLDKSIFKEMSEKYPKVSSLRSNIELKQNIDFLSMPCDFDISSFIYEAEDKKVNAYEALAVLLQVIRLACSSNGYYSILNRRYYDMIAAELHKTADDVKNLIDFLTTMDTPFVYIFEDEGIIKITNVFSVRTFETVQSARRNARNAQNEIRQNDKKGSPKKKSKATSITSDSPQTTSSTQSTAKEFDVSNLVTVEDFDINEYSAFSKGI